jgi:hypothetical protein
MDSLFGDNIKHAKVIDCLANIVIQNRDAAELCLRKGFIEKFLDILYLLAVKFNSSLMILETPLKLSVQNEIFELLFSLLRFLSIEISLTEPQSEDEDFNVKIRRYKKHYFDIANNLKISSLFATSYSHRAVDLIFLMVNGFSDSLTIVNPNAVHIIIILTPIVDTETAEYSMVTLLEYVKFSSLNAFHINNCGITCNLIRMYFKILKLHLSIKLSEIVFIIIRFFV